MATTTTTTNKPLNPRAQDLSPKGYNRAALFSGKALSFDGVNDQVTCANVSQINTGDVSVALNVRFGSSGVKDEVMFWQGTAATNSTMAFLLNSVGAIRFSVYGAGNDVDAPVAETQTNVWMHLVMTFNRTTKAAKIYKNGRLIASGTTSGVPTTTGDFLIGRNSTTAFATISMAGLKLYGAELTAAQVADLYLNPEKITPDGVATSALKLWLPMMEGAGASAYDGSGNGNDGTINGATWTAGVGAPVAQTALVSWNKGINGVKGSEDLASGDWIKNDTSVTANTIAAPNGTTTADTLSNNTTNSTHRFYQLVQAFTGTGALSFSIYLKYKDHRYFSFGLTDDSLYRAQIVVDLLNGTITDNFVDGSTTITSSTLTAVGDGWYKLSATINATGAWGSNIYALGVMLNQSTFTSAGYAGTGTGVYIWGAQANIGTAQPYIKTNATAQTSAVLVPEGLTAGASIFGTDIITPRNAFALNLDGASWAQVGDNTSLDLADAITLEAWVYNTGKSDQKGVLGKWFYPDYGAYLLYNNAQNSMNFFVNNAGGTSGSTSIPTGWSHFVATYDKVTLKLYKNGTLANSSSYTSSLILTDIPVEIGRYSKDATTAYQEPIANPRIYNRALTAAEVLRNYNADKAKFGL